MRTVTIKFHKSLQKYTNNIEKHTIEVDSYFEAIRSCIGLFPKLEHMFKSFLSGKNIHEELCLIVNNKIIPSSEIYFPPKKDSIVNLCPILYGAGSNGSTILAVVAIVALVAIAIYAPVLFPTAGQLSAASTAGGMGFIAGAAATTTTATLVASAALSIALSIASATFLAPTPKAIGGRQDNTGAEPRRNNDAFEGITNTTSTGVSISLHYGQTRVGGQLISGYIKTVNHQKNDIIEVGDYV